MTDVTFATLRWSASEGLADRRFDMVFIAGIAGLVSFVCWILVLVKMFPKEGALKGILGIICGLYAFIWGWQHKDELANKNIMPAWTGAFVVGLIANIASR
jgi:hypothetical protein